MRWTAEGRIIFSPSDLINYMESQFVSWMDRLYKLFPDVATPDESDDNTKILQTHGDQHERAFLQDLLDQGKDVYEVIDGPDAVQATLAAMRAGHEVIYQGTLALSPFQGRSDFLVRNDNTPSAFGSYSYEVWDTKLARKAKPYFIIQLCCYAEMLADSQLVLPENIAVVLGNKEIEYFRTSDYFHFYKTLKQSFLDFHANFDPQAVPEEIELPSFTRWMTHGESLLEQRDDLIRVANIRRVQIRKLHSSGVRTMSQLAETDMQRIPKMQETTFNALQQQARLQIASAPLDRPLYEVLPPSPLDPRTGLALLPPAAPLDIFFDMEGYPHLEGGLEYLFGATFIDSDGSMQFKDWWAHDRHQERVAFEEFIDWAYDRWKQQPAMHIYHYAAYEVSAMRRLMGRYGTREFELDELLRNEVFIDLYQIVRQSLRVGEPSYSIKNIEHLYMEKRSGAVSKATDSVVYYERWLEAKESADWQQSPILKDIRDYNKVDCDSTLYLAKWLWQVQANNQVSYIPKGAQCGSKTDPELAADDGEPSEDEQPISARDQAATLMLEMLAEIPDEFRGQLDSEQPQTQQDSADIEHWRLHRLLAWLLCFHSREDKPVYWSRFDRHSMSEEELYDDMDCLAGIQRDSTCTVWGEPAGKNKNAQLLYEFTFDPAQDTKLNDGSDVLYVHDLSQSATIDNIDRLRGRVTIKVSQKKPAPPDRLSLMPKDFAGVRVIADSILRTVLQWQKQKTLPQAIEDFLLRRKPRIKHHEPGTFIVQDNASAEDIAAIVARLDGSTISIQGPPGAGKTYTGSAVIAHLLQLGYRVGITSNSHAAIEQLQDRVVEWCARASIDCRPAKIGPKSQKSNGTKVIPNAKALFEKCADEYNLIGGTAYAFSHESAVDSLDFLFVDEAGQVSIANLVGTAPSTKNIVLLGDQMQLDQPIQGSHPGESGSSTLEYLLRDFATVPPDVGIFLGSTRRMCPDICRVISEVVYDSRLRAHACTKQRSIAVTPDLTHLRKHEGILYVPVSHEGNTQGSIEEAQVIAEIIGQLLQCEFSDNAVKRLLTPDDILVVAPYNMQVRNIQKLAPQQVRVGSVDRFQGQEAPVVILSMCTSDGASSPRGIEFIFSQNRLNVAISRAQCLAIIVGSPALSRTKCTTITQMKLANFFCRLVEEGRPEAHSAVSDSFPTQVLSS